MPHVAHERVNRSSEQRNVTRTFNTGNHGRSSLVAVGKLHVHLRCMMLIHTLPHPFKKPRGLNNICTTTKIKSIGFARPETYCPAKPTHAKKTPILRLCKLSSLLQHSNPCGSRCGVSALTDQQPNLLIRESPHKNIINPYRRGHPPYCETVLQHTPYKPTMLIIKPNDCLRIQMKPGHVITLS